MQPNGCPPEPALTEVVPNGQQDVMGASSSDYSNSEDEYTHIEEPTPVSEEFVMATIAFESYYCLRIFYSYYATYNI